MEKSADTQLKPMAAFIDIEGFGMSVNPKMLESKMRVLLRQLPLALAQRGFALTTTHGFASKRVGQKRLLNQGYQNHLTNTFMRAKMHMTWSDGIADDALIAEVVQQLSTKTLPKSVLLITNDGDFIPLAEKLLRYGRFVLVSGRNMHRGFVSRVSSVMPLDRLLFLDA